MNVFQYIMKVGEDKVIHFLVSLIIAEFFTRLVYSIIPDKHWLCYVFSFFTGWTITQAIGWWKEQYDKTHGGVKDFKDLTADAIGGFAGALFAVVCLILNI